MTPTLEQANTPEAAAARLAFAEPQYRANPNLHHVVDSMEASQSRARAEVEARAREEAEEKRLADARDQADTRRLAEEFLVAD